MTVTSKNLPQPPISADLERIRTKYRIDVEAGRAYNSEGEVGSTIGEGYVYLWTPIGVLKRANLVWWAATGEWPKQQLDHINRDRNDDKISNLKESTDRENNANREKEKPSGLPLGVYYRPELVGRPYNAKVRIGGKNKFLGNFATPEQASQAYKDAVHGIEAKAISSTGNHVSARPEEGWD